VGGIAGLTFVTLVVVQNLLRGASIPGNDASAADVTAFYRDHRGLDAVLAALFVIGAFAIALYAGAMVARLRDAGVDGPRFAGLIGVVGIFALFSMTEACDLALSAIVHREHPEPASVVLLWSLHNAVFTILLVAIAVALAGLSAASAGAGLVGRRWKEIGGVGAILLAITAATAPAVIDGSPVMALGLVGFVAWLAFMAVSSRALLQGT
jgi:hypothetical protein